MPPTIPRTTQPSCSTTASARRLAFRFRLGRKYLHRQGALRLPGRDSACWPERARGARLAWQSDRLCHCDDGVRQRNCDNPVGGVHGKARGARAPRRGREPLRGEGRPQGGQQRRQDDRGPCQRHGHLRPGRLRRRPDRARRHRGQITVARAAALASEMPLYRYLGGAQSHLLPLPMANILNGGVHADTSVDVQEFMVCPVGAPSFAEALRAVSEVYHELKRILKSQNLSTAVGDEGGFAPDLAANEDALKLIVEAIRQAGYKPGDEVALALDIAA